jgi:xanthine dehydrogenase iron-sulfur cluster and FAD-binding subunit A
MRRLNRDRKERITLTLNGRKVAGDAEPRMLLSDFLRQSLGATGTHVGCEHGVCGCCTVMIDGAAVRSCLTLAAQAEGREVRTVESLAGPDGKLNKLQAAFQKHHALQAGHPDVVHRLPRAQPEADRGRLARGVERSHLPLYRLCRDHGGVEGSRGAG